MNPPRYSHEEFKALANRVQSIDDTLNEHSKRFAVREETDKMINHRFNELETAMKDGFDKQSAEMKSMKGLLLLAARSFIGLLVVIVATMIGTVIDGIVTIG